MLAISKENQTWLDEVYSKIIDKESKVIKRSGTKIPYTTVDGVFDDRFGADKPWWTNGFWEGIVWQMYGETKDEYFKELGNKLEERMDEALYGLTDLHHDVGFMWLLSAVANYRLTGNEKSKIRGLTAANFLASRYTPEGGFISAWNGKERQGWAIIDCMMNIPLLYWATNQTDYKRYSQIAVNHADKTLHNAIRPDGSVKHIVEYDINDGSLIREYGGQGYADGSSWTRGHAWGLYGFVLSYIHTKETRYLDAAKNIAHYFIAAVSDTGYIPKTDFRCPYESEIVDTTAGAIAACGLIEISKNADEYEQRMYLNAAVKILKAMEQKYADWSDNCDAILRCGAEAYHSEKGNIDIIYGDYFFIEAIFKLNGSGVNFW